jgi:hypothetical protein
MMTGKFLSTDQEWSDPLNIMQSYPGDGEYPGVVVPLPMCYRPVEEVLFLFLLFVSG